MNFAIFLIASLAVCQVAAQSNSHGQYLLHPQPIWPDWINSILALMRNQFQEIENQANDPPPTTVSYQIDKCHNSVTWDNCNTYIGRFFVFDSQLQSCIIRRTGCDVEAIRQAGFSTKQECEQDCLNMTPTVKPTPTPEQLRAKCSFRYSNPCNNYVGRFLVFDANQQTCIDISSGCYETNYDQVAFESRRQCEETCLGNSPEPEYIPDTPRVPPSNQDYRCSYEKLKPACGDSFGGAQLIVYDSIRKECTSVIDSCDSSGIQMYSFSSLLECEKTCRGFRGERLPYVRPVFPVPDRFDYGTRCSHRKSPTEACSNYIGNYTVYNDNFGDCTYQTIGCDVAAVKANAFNSRTDCEIECLGLIIN